MTNPMSRFSLICCALLLISLATPVNAELVADFLMLSDPEFHDLPLVKDFQRDFKGVWLQALKRPEADYQRLAAETVARAHEHGIPDLIGLAPTLEAILNAPASHPAARFAAARALIVLESRESAASLLAAGMSHDPQLRQLIEPSLARWEFDPARAVWKKRLQDSQAAAGDLILAVRCLARIREASALPAILKIAADPLRPSHIRLEAAQAAGEIADSGLDAEAEQLAHDRRSNPLINRLCAVRYLARHSSESARRLLIELAVDPEPSLAAAALRRLNGIDPDLVVPLAEQAMQNGDPHVREAGVIAYVRRPTPERIKPLALLLDDDHPSVRKLVSQSLFDLSANPQFDPVIREQSMRVLAGNRWQGQVQAALVLGMLDHKPAANRFVELLESTRPDVMVHMAWGLRKLAEPHTIPAIVDKIRRQTVERKTRYIPGLDDQVAHLFEACMKLQVKEVEPLMMRYIPDKDRSMDNSRSTAIWTLGHRYAGTPNEDLSEALIARVLDDSTKPIESPLVKQMSVVALSRMEATKYVPALKRSIALHVPASALDLATRWAIHRLTGEELSVPTPRRYPDGVWFLEPIVAPTRIQE